VLTNILLKITDISYIQLYFKYKYIFGKVNISKIQLYRIYENILIFLEFGITLKYFGVNSYFGRCINDVFR
jgi:hypothetical protein